MFCEIRDEDGSVESVGLVNSTAEAVLWFHEHGLTLEDVTTNDNGYSTVFSYSRSEL